MRGKPAKLFNVTKRTMKTAAQLVNPQSYVIAYNKGAQAAKDKIYMNPYNHVTEAEQYDGYDDGYNDNLEPIKAI